MDLVRFEADVRAALATGKYRLRPGSWGGGVDPDGKVYGCLVMVALLYSMGRPQAATYTQVAAERYGGSPDEVWQVIDGFDYPALYEHCERQTTRLGARLHRELFPVFGGPAPSPPASEAGQ